MLAALFSAVLFRVVFELDACVAVGAALFTSVVCSLRCPVASIVGDFAVGGAFVVRALFVLLLWPVVLLLSVFALDWFCVVLLVLRLVVLLVVLVVMLVVMHTIATITTSI